MAQAAVGGLGTVPPCAFIAFDFVKAVWDTTNLPTGLVYSAPDNFTYNETSANRSWGGKYLQCLDNTNPPYIEVPVFLTPGTWRVSVQGRDYGDGTARSLLVKKDGTTILTHSTYGDAPESSYGYLKQATFTVSEAKVYTFRVTLAAAGYLYIRNLVLAYVDNNI